MRESKTAIVAVTYVAVQTVYNGTRRKKMKRSKMSKSASRKNFSSGAALTHKKNVSPSPMRGGIRL